MWGSNPAPAILHEDGPAWSAAPDAVTADLVGHMQITSCYYGTVSCPPIQWGDSSLFGGPADDTVVFRTHLDLIQLDPAGQPCQVTSTQDVTYTISNRAHHFLVDYGPARSTSPQPVAGHARSRRARVVTWISGNPVKIDSGANTNANIIVKTTVPTRTVPDVTLTDEGSASARLQGAGLTVGSVTPVVNFAAPGTVLAQNPPAGTVEPQGSPVDLTVSLGAVVVPDVTGVPLAEATR